MWKNKKGSGRSGESAEAALCCKGQAGRAGAALGGARAGCRRNGVGGVLRFPNRTSAYPQLSGERGGPRSSLGVNGPHPCPRGPGHPYSLLQAIVFYACHYSQVSPADCFLRPETKHPCPLMKRHLCPHPCPPYPDPSEPSSCCLRLRAMWLFLGISSPAKVLLLTAWGPPLPAAPFASHPACL